MLGAWLIAHRWKFLATSVRAWKLPDWICWLCSAPWTAWIFLPRKSRSRLSYGNSLHVMPITQRLFGRWTSLREDRIAVPGCAIVSEQDQLPAASAQFRKQLPARAHPTLEQLEGRIRKALNHKEAYNMVPGRDPENV